MESLGNVNHAIIILGYWIFYMKYEKSLCLTQESLDLICSSSVGEEQVETFQSIFMLLYTFGKQFIFKKDKHDTASK